MNTLKTKVYARKQARLSPLHRPTSQFTIQYAIVIVSAEKVVSYQRACSFVQRIVSDLPLFVNNVKLLA